MKKGIEILFRKISKERGLIAENKIFEALEILKRENQIVSFYKTSRKEDKERGIDFVIFDLNGQKIELQVKSSKMGARQHAKKFPNIPVIILRGGESQDIIKNKILEIIKNQP